MNNNKHYMEFSECLTKEECNAVNGGGGGLIFAIFSWISDNWTDLKQGFSDGSDAVFEVK